jgi:CBS domain-containing protein
MKTAREIMTSDAEWVAIDRPVLEAARRMAELDVGALPVCDGEGHLQGMITDRDIVVKVLAAGMDPGSTSVSAVADQQGEVVTIGADDPIDEVLRTMTQYAVRRLPVIDGTDLVGMVSQADVATELDSARVGEAVEAISQAPSNSST